MEKKLARLRKEHQSVTRHFSDQPMKSTVKQKRKREEEESDSSSTLTSSQNSTSPLQHAIAEEYPLPHTRPDISTVKRGMGFHCDAGDDTFDYMTLDGRFKCEVTTAGFEAYGMCVSKARDEVILSSCESGKFMVFNTNPPNLLLRTFGGKEHLQDPGDLALDESEQELFALDTENHCIGVFDTLTGQFLRKFELPEDTQPFCELEVVGECVWFSTYHPPYIAVISKHDGKLVREIKQGLNRPRNIARFGEMVAVSDEEGIKLLTRDGVVKHVITSTTPHNKDAVLRCDTDTLWVRTNSKLIGYRFKQPLALALFAGLHHRTGKKSLLLRLYNTHSLFEKQAFRLILRLAGAMFSLK